MGIDGGRSGSGGPPVGRGAAHHDHYLNGGPNPKPPSRNNPFTNMVVICAMVTLSIVTILFVSYS
jgi:hypothetical protein